jgi:hypothetical protein
VLLFFAPGAVVYLILRPRETLDEAYQRTIAEEYLVQDLEEFAACPSCRRPTRDEYVFCPHCRVELRRACGACGKFIDLRWDTCAYCGSAAHDSARVPAIFDAAQWAEGSEPGVNQSPDRQSPAVATDNTVKTGSIPIVPGDDFASIARNGSHEAERPTLGRVTVAPDRDPGWVQRPDGSSS